ncbi:dihydrolipoyl dehydrogenase [Natronobacterium gregoryi]|uniref:Dihydrolipoamide dehydrogenase n=2 Tax=Natronobacterium gregoryi TaxID=44930 RepID=L0AH57_NATGS|nr:dihydrolipoyl dehydrogenase [Natronobacterium gregoryi]AFZ72764.1 pyruvate/2-oxoglutarate dehydrogenase complex, dihydrolipoamide dehydrogenase component [Natronobacterium gregoryi SP2]ELY69471.1 dihydrolipoamide dehydrogenase [Natronobacterium gregoryi SP2]PLK21107.1 dihydrolipoyl dehydrogenase [Natronobacterium gregoryi SP2]SFJ11387.1 dihydrolipoamide dehydrogenase [Natronobacterium gregoryi]
MTEYDVVVIGGGSGSQVATAAADRGLGAAVVERGPLGGACITRGCIPSKALIHRADVVEEIQRAKRAGIDATLEGVAYDEITDAIYDAVYEKADRQAESLEEAENVTLYRGEGRFVDDRTLAVDGNDETHEISGEQLVVAVGSRPVEPPIDGLEDVDYLTSDDALYLDDRPDELAIVGGGYIGAELGYFFGALGTDVSIVGRSDHLIPREDDEIRSLVTGALAEYCELYTGHGASSVAETDGDVLVTAEPSDDGDAVEITADDLLLATGRVPNTDTLDLETTAIETDDSGFVETDERLETAVDGVWALGDAVGDEPYKHAADYESRVVAANALDADGQKVDYDAMPHAIFTSPQVASVGKTEDELEAGNRSYESATVPFDVSPLGSIREADGLVKVLAAPDGDILGCHVAGPEAASLIQEVVVAMDRSGGTVADVVEPVHVHPALSESIYAAFDELADREFSTAPDWRDGGD